MTFALSVLITLILGWTVVCLPRDEQEFRVLLELDYNVDLGGWDLLEIREQGGVYDYLNNTACINMLSQTLIWTKCSLERYHFNDWMFHAVLLMRVSVRVTDHLELNNVLLDKETSMFLMNQKIAADRCISAVDSYEKEVAAPDGLIRISGDEVVEVITDVGFYTLITDDVRKAATIGQQPLNETILAEIVNHEVHRKLSGSFELGLVRVITIFPYGNTLIAKFKLPIKRKLRESKMDLPELWHVRLIGAVKMAASKGRCRMNFLLPVVKDEDPPSAIDFKIQININSAPEGRQFEDKPCDLFKRMLITTEGVRNFDDIPVYTCAVRRHLADEDNWTHKELRVTVLKEVLQGQHDSDWTVRNYFAIANNRVDLVVSMTDDRPSYVVFVAAPIRGGLPPNNIDSNQASQADYCAYLRDALELSAATTSCSEFNKLVLFTEEVVEVRMRIAKTTTFNTQSPSHWYIPSQIAEKLNSNGCPNIYNVRWDRRYKYPDAV